MLHSACTEGLQLIYAWGHVGGSPLLSALVQWGMHWEHKALYSVFHDWMEQVKMMFLVQQMNMLLWYCYDNCYVSLQMPTFVLQPMVKWWNITIQADIQITAVADSFLKSQFILLRQWIQSQLRFKQTNQANSLSWHTLIMFNYGWESIVVCSRMWDWLNAAGESVIWYESESVVLCADILYIGPAVLV